MPMPVETIQRLREIMPPPEHPYAAGTPDAWLPVETQLGFTLPHDYKEFINAYGSGRIAHLVSVNSPFDPRQGTNLMQAAESELGSFRQARARDVAECPYPLYPDPEGLFPWGTDAQEHALFWWQVGPPDSWPVVVTASRASYFWRFEQTLTEMLVSWLTWERFYEPFPAWYLDPTQFPDEDEIDEEGHGSPPRLPSRPRPPEEARALFKPYGPPRDLNS